MRIGPLDEPRQAGNCPRKVIMPAAADGHTMNARRPRLTRRKKASFARNSRHCHMGTAPLSSPDPGYLLPPSVC
ncbi:hypothetical protein Aduo_018064 [Ancylostoma duodenale]